MKRYTPLVLLAILVLPFSANAFSLDDVVKQWMVYMRQKVATLEAENAALKAQLKSCSATTPSTTASKETLEEVAEPNIKVTVTADPARVEYGGTTTLSWVAEGATSCTMNSSPVLLAPTGSQPTDRLTSSTSYTFTCTDKNTAVTGSSTVTVPVSYYCIGGIPANASPWDYEEATDLTGVASWGYSGRNTPTKCEFRCFPGNVWNSGACVRPTSTGGSSGSGWPPASA